MPAVDLCPDRRISEIGVDRIGEIHRSRALGQLVQRAFGGEGEDAVLIDGEPGMLEQLVGIVAFIDDLDQVAQPANLAVGLVALLVGPVRGEAEFVGAMHLAGADLDFHAHRVFIDQRGVQRAVAVGLGGGDVVLEAARDHLPGGMQDAERAVAISRRFGQHAKRHDIGDLLEGDMALLHLLPDRIGMLLAAPDLDPQPRLGERLLDRQGNHIDLAAIL